MKREKNPKTNYSNKMLILSLGVIILFAIEKFILGGITRVEGVKIGLYNMFIVFAIIDMKPKHAYLLIFIKIITGAFLTAQVIMYPLAGGLLSVSAMLIANKLFSEKIGYIGVSIVGAVIYNLVVYIIASLSLASTAVFYNIPIVLVLSVIYGSLTGGFAYLISRIKLFRLGYGEENENI